MFTALTAAVGVGTTVVVPPVTAPRPIYVLVLVRTYIHIFGVRVFNIRDISKDILGAHSAKVSPIIEHI